MSLPVPVVDQEPGPDYADDINQCMAIVDSHDHTSGSGKPITTEAISIDNDLSLQGFALTDAQQVQLLNNSGSLSSRNSVYVEGGDLIYNTSDGTPVPITVGSQLASSGSNSTFAQFSVTSNLTLAASAPYSTLLVNTTATRTITLPDATSAPGRRFTFYDVSGQSLANAITLAPSGSDSINGSSGNFLLQQDFGAWTLESDGSGGWWLLASQQTDIFGNVNWHDNTVLELNALMSVSGTLDLTNCQNVLIGGIGGTIFSASSPSGGQGVFLPQTGLTFRSGSFNVLDSPKQMTLTGPGNSGLPGTGFRRQLVQSFKPNSPVATGWSNNFGSLIGPGTSATQYCFLDELHDLATFAAITITFSVGQAHSGVPATLPNFQVLQYEPSTHTFTTIANSSVPTPSTGTAWFASGATQTFTLTLSTSPAVNKSRFVYYIAVTDEFGTNALSGNSYASVTVDFQKIASMWWT